MRQIQSGSFTRLTDFEECALKAKLKYVDRVPEPDRGPPPKGKKEWPNDRGTRIHDEAEQFIKGEGDQLPVDLLNFNDELYQTRELFKQGLVETEEMWCYGEGWKVVNPEDTKRTKFRIKADLCAQLTPSHSMVVDFKTGRRYGNEMKHGQQKQTYAIGKFLRDEKLLKVTTELWYLDLPSEDIFSDMLTRKQAFVLLRPLNTRLNRMLDATVFPPNANKYNCRWCPYNGKNGEKVCKHAVV